MQCYLSGNFAKYVILSKKGGKEEGSCCKTAFLGASHSAKALCKADKYVIGELHPTKNVCSELSFPFLKVQCLPHLAKSLFSRQLLSVLRNCISLCQIAALQRQLKVQDGTGLWGRISCWFYTCVWLGRKVTFSPYVSPKTHSNSVLSNTGKNDP